MNKNRSIAKMTAIAYENNISEEVMVKVRWYINEGVEVRWDDENGQFLTYNHIIDDE